MEKKGKLYDFLDRLSDLVILGFLWLVTSLPVITVASSSAALYYAASKSVRFQESRPVKSFFHSFRENWKPGWKLSLIYAVFTVFFIISFENTWGNWSVLAVLFTGIVLLSSGIYCFSILSRFTMKTFQYVQAGLFFTVHYIGKTLLLLFTFLLCAAVTAIFPFLLPVLAGGYAYYSTFFIEKIFAEYMNLTPGDTQTWYAKGNE